MYAARWWADGDKWYAIQSPISPAAALQAALLDQDLDTALIEKLTSAFESSLARGNTPGSALVDVLHEPTISYERRCELYNVIYPGPSYPRGPFIETGVQAKAYMHAYRRATGDDEARRRSATLAVARLMSPAQRQKHAVFLLNTCRRDRFRNASERNALLNGLGISLMDVMIATLRVWHGNKVAPPVVAPPGTDPIGQVLAMLRRVAELAPEHVQYFTQHIGHLMLTSEEEHRLRARMPQADTAPPRSPPP